MKRLGADLRFAWRTLRARPAFAAVAVLSLALGIGANTAIFSVVESSLLRGLPYPHADRLIVMREHQPNFATASLAPGEYLDYQAQTKTLSGVAAWTFPQITLTGSGEPQKLKGITVTTNFFDVLGARPELGRLMSPKIDRSGAGMRVAVISDATWHSVFGADPKIVGRDIVLNGQKFRVIGVLPQKQAYPGDEQIWISPRLDVPEYQETGNSNVDQIYDNHWLLGLGRLKPGVTPGEARAELQTIAANIGKRHPDEKGNYAIFSFLQNALVQDLRPSLLVLLAAVVFLLLIACANLAGLLLARATGRTRELAIRVALGATRREIMGLLLSESLLFASFGGAFGVLLAWVGVRLLLHYSPYDLPAALAPELNFPVLAFCLGVTLGSALLSGLVPAFHAAQIDVNSGLKEGSKGSKGRPTHRLRSLLVGGQIAVSVMLLVGASLLIHSFSKLINVDPGFDPNNVISARISLPETRYKGGAPAIFWDKLLSRLNTQGSRESAGIMMTLPLSGQNSGGGIQAEGQPTLPDSQVPYANWNIISPRTFSVLRVPLLQGRTFNERDTAKSTHVAVVNKIFADKVFPHENPIGKRVKGGYFSDWTTIIGVVGDVKYDGLDEKPELELYYDYPQVSPNYLGVVVRYDTGSRSAVAALRRIVHNLDANIPLTDVKPLGDYLGASLAARKFLLGLLTTFSALAILLAAIGLYAVLAYSVQQRKQEIGIRVALGASRGDVLWLILRECLTIAVIGTAVGLLGATWATSFLKSMLYGVTTTDITAYIVSVALILTVAIAAALAPALRATRIDPVSALRYE